MCSHIASILWYLGYARHNSSQSYGIQNWGEFVEDAGQIPQAIEEDETDSDNDSVIEE